MFVACRLYLERSLELISDKEQKCQIYHTLHTLLDEDDNNFELLFNEFKTRTVNNESTQCLTKYFELEYSQHKHQYATRHGKITGIDTNMYVEVFHQPLNYLCMKEKISINEVLINVFIYS